MTKQEFLDEYVDLIKEMTPEERGKFLADLTFISINLSLSDKLSPESKKAIINNERKVS